MNRDINPDRKQEKQKKSKQVQKKDSDKWTFGRSFLFLLITFDIVVVATWLIYYYSQYEQISKIVGGVWTAVITTLSFLKIKRGRKKSLAEFLQILPVKMVIITYTVIIFFLAGIFVFAEFPVHTVHITAIVEDKPQSGVLITWDKNPYDKTGEAGTLIIPSVKAGKHTVKGEFGECQSETETVNIPLFSLKYSHKVIIPLVSVLISSSSEGKEVSDAEIYIDGIKQDKLTPATINVCAGEHSIKLFKIIDGYMYEGEREVTVEAVKTNKVDIELIPVTGTLNISSIYEDEEVNGAEIYIDDIKKDEQTPATIKVSAGKHSIKLVKTIDGCKSEEEKEITVEAHKTENVNIELIRAMGDLQISSNFRGETFDGAEIYIDGEKHSEQTPATIKVCAGEHSVELVKILDDYCYEGVKKIIVEEDKNNSADIELKLVGQACKLLIRSKPTGANIYINGEPHGTTDATVVLCPGTYAIRLEKSGYTPVEKKIDVEKLKDSITISLSKK